MRIFLGLDGTSDVTAEKRAREAGRVAPSCLVCVLPPERDPDELTAEEIAALERDARPVLDEWIELLNASPINELSRRSELFAEQVGRWFSEFPGLAGELRRRISAGLGLSDEEMRGWLKEHGQGGDCGSRVDGNGACGSETAKTEPQRRAARDGENPLFPGQPVALGRPADGAAGRGEITNFVWEERLTPDEKALKNISGPVSDSLRRLRLLDKAARAAKAQEKELSTDEQNELDELVRFFSAAPKPVMIAKDSDAIRGQIRERLRGWPMKLVSGTLFVDDVRETPFGPPVRMVGDATKFLSLLHDYSRVKFNRSQDADKTNYISVETMFSNLLSAHDTPEWMEVERYPHEPAMAGHYYAWRGATSGYVPTGEALSAFLGFFDQIIDPRHRALFAAAVVTVFWGGPCGARPFFFFYASEQGSGKTTAAEKICGLVGGFAAVNFDQRSEERLKERILSDEFSGTRCLLADNIVGKIESPLMAELATATRISGKKLAVGEAWRPNTLVVFLTGNNPDPSRDTNERTFFVKFEPIKNSNKDVTQRNGWADELDAFLAERSADVMADCLAILRSAAPAVDLSGVTAERNSRWVLGVLAKVMAHPRVAAVIGATTLRDVLIYNEAFRRSVDNELDEADRFMQALLERVCVWKSYGLAGENGSLANSWPHEPVFVRSAASEKTSGGGGEGHDDDESRQNVTTVWRSSIRGDVNPSWVSRRVNAHIEAGRLPALTPYRSAAKRGYHISPEAVVRFLAEQAGKEPATVVAEWAATQKPVTA